MIDSLIFNRILALLAAKKYLVSRHALKEAADDDILITDLISGIAFGEVIEDYPDYHKGPCCLILQQDSSSKPVHALWGIPRGRTSLLC